jgi:hypothetical protein
MDTDFLSAHILFGIPSSGLSHSYSTHGDKNMVKLDKLTDSNRRFGSRRTPEPPAINQVTIPVCHILVKLKLAV